MYVLKIVNKEVTKNRKSLLRNNSNSERNRNTLYRNTSTKVSYKKS